VIPGTFYAAPGVKRSGTILSKNKVIKIVKKIRNKKKMKNSF
jgi:hypothetical protein